MASVTRTRPVPVTVEWWDGFVPPDGYRAEIIGGEVVLTPSPGPDHQFVATELGAVIRAAVRGAAPGEYAVMAPGEWRFDVAGLVARAPEPDVVVRRLDRARHVTETPVLCVEVLSKSDGEHLAGGLTRIEGKRLDYAAGGLADYLEVELPSDPGAPTAAKPVLRRYELRDGVLVQVDEVTGDGSLATDRPFPLRLIPSALALPPEL